MHQNRYQQPSKEEVRRWLKDGIESHRPPPEPDVIREQLWHMERERKQVLS